MSETIRAVDLFAGAGGISWGLVLAVEAVAETVDLAAVNHWERAIETHEKNHPWADHYHAKVEELQPTAVMDPGIDILTAGPECTHFSSARGGKPVDEQKRASPWHALDWMEKLRPKHFLLENVKEITSWGPIEDDGTPSRNGAIFEAWVDSLHALGYAVDWQVLNAADYGDATTRERLFVVGRRDHQPSFPEPTHSQDGEQGTEEWRPAADIIDWSERGESIWERSRPLANSTMQRIAMGLRRFGGERIEPFADTVAGLTPGDVESMQEDVVDADEMEVALEDRDEAFLVRSGRRPVAADGGRPVEVSSPFVLGQHGGSRPRDVTETPVPTIATRGAISLVEPEAFVLPLNGRARGLDSNLAYDSHSRPLHTVTAQNHDGHLVSPFLVVYYGNSDAVDVSDPLPTVTTRDRFALVLPDRHPWGLDIRFRMLQPRELAAAQGFPSEYEFVGNKTETTEQIGNAVPVHLSKALVEHLLSDTSPSLFTDAPGAKPVATDGGGQA